ncbi:androgen-dependent TFPI-regulating protein [Nilaparvata lugens]|uniref:androgen-dependent TFPI-regulating protein n=1 Tax=Nilaparvata lugens TaxID=108931 RepID=UPI000B9810E2|nr:androgen-dependent TFPI-regulating protein [Nilaparvata lugens]XP_039277401.1 androgen-dependent TFPI-regulating protein [Nilaparvata lugens]
MLIGAFHTAVAAFYIFVSHWMFENVVKGGNHPNLHPQVKIMQQYTLRYLTNWTFVLQNVFFITSAIFDLTSLFIKAERLRERTTNFKSYIFTVLAAPSAMIVSLVFWSLWAVDRELIYPSHMDTVLPVWTNHSLHTTTTLFAIAEMFLCQHKFPSFKQGLKGITIYLTLYGICLNATYFESGFWLYPILKDLTWNLRIVMYLTVYVVCLGLFLLNKFACSLVWGNKQQTASKKQKKNKKKN